MFSGALLRPVLLPSAGERALRLRRADPRRAYHQAHAGPCSGDRDGPRGAHLRVGAGGLLLQHGGRHRRRRHISGQVPQDPHPPREGLLREVLLPAGQHRLSGFRHGGGPHRRLHLLRPAFPGGMARPGLERGEDRFQPFCHQPRAVDVSVESGAAGLCRRQRVFRRRDQPGRAGAIRRQRLLRVLLLCRPEGSDHRRVGFGHRGGAGDPRLGPRHDRGGASAVGFLSGPAPGCVWRPGSTRRRRE